MSVVRVILLGSTTALLLRPHPSDEVKKYDKILGKGGG